MNFNLLCLKINDYILCMKASLASISLLKLCHNLNCFKICHLCLLILYFFFVFLLIVISFISRCFESFECTIYAVKTLRTDILDLHIHFKVLPPSPVQVVLPIIYYDVCKSMVSVFLCVMYYINLFFTAKILGAGHAQLQISTDFIS